MKQRSFNNGSYGINMSCNSYRITPNLRIGQIVFEELTDGMTEDLLYQNESTPVYQDEDVLVE